jgi:Nucleotidyl transferase AbiEii toxin, Type IV TA system
MAESRTYASPSAFRRALTDRLKTLASTSRWSLPQLQRQIAYDRLLERLYLTDDGWIVKGATSLLARDIGVRGTRDVDVYREAAREVAERDLRNSASRDIGDWFRLELAASQPTGDGPRGVRIPVTACIGTAPWAQFHVDLVGSDIGMTGQPDDVPPLAQVSMPGIEQRGYRAYPLVDHVADKVAATYQRYGDRARPSTRYRDLVDLVAIVIGADIPARPQMAALDSEAKRRGIALPARFDAPDRNLWTPGYAAAAADSLLPGARTLDEALDVVRPFLDPLLGRTATGMWDHQIGEWAT